MGGAGGHAGSGGKGPAALSFTKEESGVAEYLSDAWSFGDGEAYAVGDNGTVLHREPSGVWTAQASGTTTNLEAVWALSPTLIFAAGNDTVLRSSGDGQWTQETLPADSMGVSSIWGVSADEVYAVSATSWLRRDGAGVWSAIAPAPFFSFHVWAAGPGDAWFSGFTQIHHLLNGVQTDQPTVGELEFDVCGASATEVVFVAEHDVSATLVDGAWVSLLTTGMGDPQRCRFAKPGDLFVFGYTATETHDWGRVGRVDPAAGTVTPHVFAEYIHGGAATAKDVIAVGYGGAIYRALVTP